MTYENFIGLRYLMAKRHNRVVSVITLISVAGVALGVTAMIVVLSVMGGFKKDLKEKILGTKAHIVVKAKDHESLEEPEKVIEASEKMKRIVGASSFIEAEVMASSPTNLSGVMLRGINPDRIGSVSDLDVSIEKGKLSYLKDPTPLFEKLEEERVREREILNQEFEKARDEIEEERDRAEEGAEEPAGEDTGGADGDSGGMPSIVEDEESDDGGGGGMPPIAPSDESESEDDGGMPAIDPSSDQEDDQTDGGMPAIDPSGSDDGGMPPMAGDKKAGDSEKRQLPGIILGKELAKSLQIELGDEINIVTPDGEMGQPDRCRGAVRFASSVSSTPGCTSTTPTTDIRAWKRRAISSTGPG